MMKILVLGGTGTISRYAVDELVKNKYEVTIFNRGTRKEFISPDVIWKRVDVNNYVELFRAMEGEYYDKVIDFTTFTKEEMRMKLSLLIDKCEHYIFISSIATYENDGKECYIESDEKYNSKWGYGYRKSECEDVVKEYYKEFDDRYYTILRLGITWSESFIPYTVFDSYNMPGYIIYSILANKPLPVLNSGDDKIQVIYAGDFAKNLVELLPLAAAKNDVFNLTGDEFISSNDMLEGLCRHLKKNVFISYVPENEVIKYTLNNENIVRGGWHNHMSNEKIKSTVKNYNSKIRWADKLNETIEYFFNNPTRIRWSEENDRYCKKLIGDIYEKKYVSESNDDNKRNKVYIDALERGFLAEREKEKLIKNNVYLTKWLSLKQNDINIFWDLKSAGVDEVVLYGYGMLGIQAVNELENAGINVISVIDKSYGHHKRLKIQRDCVGLEDKVILVSVMTAYEDICDYLKENGCCKIISLGEIIDKKYEGLNKYPEVYKFKDIDKKEELEVICLGTGYGYHDFVFDGLSQNAFNFSLPQQTLKYDYIVLQNYSHKLKKGCKIIVTLQYCILLISSLKEAEEKNERYYSILPKEQVESICDISYDKYKENVVVNSSGEIVLSQPLKNDEMEKQSLEALGNWVKQLSIISYGCGRISDNAKNELNETKKVLSDMLKYCDEQGFEPIIVIVPMSKIMLDKMSEDFKRACFYEPLYEVIGDKYKVIDYSKDDFFTNPKLYGWPGFLTESAAYDFTKDVLSKLGLIK